MPPVVTPALPQHRATLENLVQLYAYDFSEIMPLDLDESGRFAHNLLRDLWTGAGRHPFLIREAEQLAGFIIVESKSRLSDEVGVFDMAEFFVVRRYRRASVGRQAAIATFNRFPGRWEIREQPNNRAGIAFWRRVIGEYTQGHFREVAWHDSRWTGPVQQFSSLDRGV